MKQRLKARGLWLRAFLLGAAVAASPGASAFDYWVLALSWSPEYCAAQGAKAPAEQCGQPRGFIVHGLWPQDEPRNPAFCDTRKRVPEPVLDRARRLTPSRGLLIHQWRKHGSCSGLDPAAYFSTMERAYQRLTLPTAYLLTHADRRLPTAELEQALLAASPDLKPEALTLHCKRQQLTEVRVCLDTSLQPRACGRSLRDSCGRELVVRAPR